MIYLEECVNQVLLEEGQLIVSPLDDLEISWEQLENLFIGTYNQAKGYVSIYDWQTQFVGIDGTTKNEWAYVRHITYNAYNHMQRFMPDVPGQYWEFNPYNKMLKSLFATDFSFEVGKYAYCGKLPYSMILSNVTGGSNSKFVLPCYFGDDFVIETHNLDTTLNPDTSMAVINETDDAIMFSGSLGNGTFNKKTMIGELTFANNADSVELSFTSKYSGIAELDLTCELFYIWFKANMLRMIGSMKNQIELPNVGLPFEISRDELLARGNELMQHVEELKVNKSHWSNF